MEVPVCSPRGHRHRGHLRARGRPRTDRGGGRTQARPRGAEGASEDAPEDTRGAPGRGRTRGRGAEEAKPGGAGGHDPPRPPRPAQARSHPPTRGRGGAHARGSPPPGAAWGAGRRARAMAGPSLRPHVHWAQRHRELYLRVELSDVQVPGGTTRGRTAGGGGPGSPPPGGVRGRARCAGLARGRRVSRAAA